MTREEIQSNVVDSIVEGKNSIIEVSMRVGKSKISLDVIKRDKPKAILWVTNSPKLRDEDIPAEFIKWKAKTYLNKTHIVTYHKLPEITGYYDLIILDEMQCSTPNNTTTLINDMLKAKTMIAMTGKLPTHKEKWEIFNQLGFKIVHRISIDDAADNNLIADYNVTVVETQLDNINKNIEAGKKGAKFKVSEYSNYEFLNNIVENTKLDVDFNINLNNKTIFLKDLYFKLQKFTPKFKCDSAYIIRKKDSIFGSEGYIVVKNDEIYGKINYKGTYYKILNNELHKIVHRMNVLKRMQFIYSLPSKLEAAKLLLNSLKGRTLLFMGSIDHAEKVCKHNYHSKTDNTHLQQFLAGKIDKLACVNAGGSGFTFLNTDNIIIAQANSNKSGSVLQKLSRNLTKQGDFKGNIYFLLCANTVDEKWVESAIQDLDKSKISYTSIKNFK